MAVFVSCNCKSNTKSQRLRTQAGQGEKEIHCDGTLPNAEIITIRILLQKRVSQYGSDIIQLEFF